MPKTAKQKTRSKLSSSSLDDGHPTVGFINKLHHTGDFTGQLFGLRAWQEIIVRAIFGPDGRPKYRKVFIALPRKQGKTELIAAILLFLILCTGKRGQRLYSASGDREQAALIYGAAASMVRQSEALSNRLICFDGYKRIAYEQANTIYQALSSDAPRKHGLRPSAVLIDELHVLPNRDLYNALMTAFGATLEPLTIMITTAGHDRTSLCYEQWEYARAVRDGLIDDPAFLPIIFEADPKDDWTSEEVWHKAMPALGDFVQLDWMRDECKMAQKIPAYENTFRQLYLNQWTEQAERWLSVESWLACADCLGGKEVSEYVGQPCYAGGDLGATGDLSAFWVVWPTPGGVKVAGRCWAPKDGKWRQEDRNKDRYLRWHQMGLLHFTPGNTTDHGVIKKYVLDFNEHTPIISLFADRAYATQLLNELFNEGILGAKGIPQGPVTLNEPCKLLEELVISQRIEHGNNEILNWAIANASVVRGTTGLMHPDKSSATERIDPLSALINALAAYTADPVNRADCVYESAGQLLL